VFATMNTFFGKQIFVTLVLGYNRFQENHRVWLGEWIEFWYVILLSRKNPSLTRGRMSLD